MIDGSLVNRTSFEEYFPELTWGERGVVFVYILAILLVSTVGNTFVLILSKDLKSVTKDSKGTILLVNIALVDLLFNVFLTLPMLVSVLSRKWVLGTGYCFLDAFFETYLGILEIMFILLITVHRTIVIKFPFKQQRMLSSRKVYVIVGFFYLFCLIPSVIRIIATIQIVGYLPEEVHCDNLEVANSGPWAKILQISLVIYAIIPVFVTVFLYIWMMMFAISKSEPIRNASHNYRIKNAEGAQMKAPNKALQTVSLIVGVYLISISMTIILIIARIRNPHIPGRAHLASICLWLLNTAVNPIIYVYNNPMFRAHLKRLILRKRVAYGATSSMMQSLRRRTTQQSMMKMSHTFRSSSLASNGMPGRESVATSPPKMVVVREESDSQAEVKGGVQRRRSRVEVGSGKFSNNQASIYTQQSVNLSTTTQISTDSGPLVLQDVEEDMSLVIQNSAAGCCILTEPSCVLTDHSFVSTDESRGLPDESRVLADESRVLSDESRVLSDESRVLSDESRVLADMPRSEVDESQGISQLQNESSI